MIYYYYLHHLPVCLCECCDRFDIEGDDETQANVPSGDYAQFPIPSPPPPDEPKIGE